LMIVCLYCVDYFGSASIMFTVYGILAIPFNLFGQPGFLLKVPISFLEGF